MGHIFTPPLDQFAEFCARGLEIPLFVETGTYLGESAAWAAARFREVVTVELCPRLHERARSAARHSNIAFHCGRSPEVLADLVSRPEPKIFWLDAHWCGPLSEASAGVDDQCPVIGELAAIVRSKSDDVILIDDFPMFAIPRPEPFRADQWPSLDELLAALQPIPDRRLFVYGNALIVARGRTAQPITDFFRRLPLSTGE